jgi:hypothetical protein
MAEVVNLRRARKAKMRTAHEEEAASRRRQFGRTKAEKTAEEAERARKARLLEGHRREPE